MPAHVEGSEDENERRDDRVGQADNEDEDRLRVDGAQVDRLRQVELGVIPRRAREEDAREQSRDDHGELDELKRHDGQALQHDVAVQSALTVRARRTRRRSCERREATSRGAR